MKSRIEDWLESRLGIIIDLKPTNFGMHAKDGTILAKLLYSYGALPLQILQSIKPSKSVNECFNNLLILKPWLEYVDIHVKDEVLHEISNGQGTTALHLFYTFFLNMINKDKLYYLSKQKERKYCQQHNLRDIKVIPLPEKEIQEPEKIYESEFAQPIIDKTYSIEWHRMKCNEVLEKIKEVKEKLVKTVQEPPTELGPVVSRHASSKKLCLKESEPEKSQCEIKKFAAKNLQEANLDLNYQQLVELQNRVKTMPLKLTPDLKEAREFIKSLRKKNEKSLLTEMHYKGMQEKLIDNMWDSMLKQQSDSFEELVCQNLLKQSQYEKQMCTKLAFVRHQKDEFVKHRRAIENLNVNCMMQKIYDDDVTYMTDMAAEDQYQRELEKQRLQELHRRVYVEKVKAKLKERHEEATNILYKLVDIAMRISEFRASFGCEMPKTLMKDMKELFFKDLPVFDVLDDVTKIYKTPICNNDNTDYSEIYGEFYEEVERPGEGEEYGEFGPGELYQGTRESCEENKEHDGASAAEFIRQEVLNECDFNDYLFLLGPWLVDVILADEGSSQPPQLGDGNQTVLGYIVHKMLACKYPTVAEKVPASIKPMNIRGIVQGPSDDSAATMLSEILALKKILLVRVDDAINFVLRAFKSEMSDVQEVDVSFQQATKNALKGKSRTERTKETLSSKKETLLRRDTKQQKKITMESLWTNEVGTQTPRNIPEDDPLLTSNAEIGKSVYEYLGVGDPVPDITVTSAIIAYVISLENEYDGWVLWNYPVHYAQAGHLENALTGYQLIALEEEADSMEGIEGFDLRSSCANQICEDELTDKWKSRLVPKLELSPVPAKMESYFNSFVRMLKKNGEPVKSNSATLGLDRVEKFYTEQEIYQCLEYSSITFQTVKEVARAVLGEFKYDDDNDPTRKSSVEIFGTGLLALTEKYFPTSKKVDAKDVAKTCQAPIKRATEHDTAHTNEFEGEFGEYELKADVNDGRKVSDSAPGDPNWKWAVGDQLEDMQLALANFWESLEVIFIEDFKFLFFCLRVHRANILRYKAFLKKALQSFMKREDDKQVILSAFQTKFNDIDDDLRPDSDVKCELHVRVSELEETLMEIADERREKSEKYRIQVISDNWVADELIVLVNLYIRALQLEGDRAIDTCQFINDYYFSLQQKVPQENVLQKIIIPTLPMSPRIFSVQDSDSKSLYSTVPSQGAMDDKISRLSIRKQKSDKKTTGTGSGVYPSMREESVIMLKGAEAIYDILVNLTFPPNVTTPLHKFFISNAEEFMNGVKNIFDGCIAGLRRGSTGLATAKDKRKIPDIKPEGNANLYEEWFAALDNELRRFLFRAKLIQARAIQDFNEFILEILNTLISISKEIGEISNREAYNITECCKVFRCAIEEERPVQPRLELSVDEFVINTDCLLYPNPSEDVTPASSTAGLKNDFTIEQLTYIVQKLQYIAPECEIVRRAFIYILEDLRVLKSEDGKPKLLPDLWDILEPNDIPRLFDMAFGRIEIVNWRDFIVYALNLQMPTDMEILDMRSAFRSFDPSGTEVISFRDFMSVRLWFEDYPIRANAYDMKELLFKLYQIGYDSTNYTALLLSFCKDEDPSVGFLKALSLSLGKRIVMDFTDDLSLNEEENALAEDDHLDKMPELFCRKGTTDSGKGKRKSRYLCECKSVSEMSTEEEAVEEAGESYGLYIRSDESQGSLFTSDVPCSVVKKVVMASYPILPQMTLLLHTPENYEETIDNMLSTINENKPTVKTSKLLRTSLISRLLFGTNKFKMLDIQSLVKAMIEDRQGNTRSCSLSWQ
ncbi:UNVERIFIED_CONTAM: hypothetical protein PYX00_003010 [Menopon gallinae]|uniref:Sperm flagellar protein 2 n=1 Tax=Menopon gallinae TaxID=328185 RepID=A0AAW2HZI7_9NEOP